MEDYILPTNRDTENALAFLKWKSIYNQTIIEIWSGYMEEESVINSIDAYQKATIRTKELHPNHPKRLEVALNYSRFLHEYCCRIA